MLGKELVRVPPGSLIRCYLPGGGGYGNPLERDPNLVLEDVVNGIVSLEKAKTEYGVVIDPETMKVNHEETEKLRKSLMGSG
jgi:N-methylhydantoinase B